MAGRNSYDLTVERGIRQRHWESCRAGDGKRCTCQPRAYIASATVNGKRTWSPTLRSLDAARAWRLAAISGDLPTVEPATGPTVREAWRRWMQAAEDGVAITKSRAPFEATTIADYDNAMRLHFLEEHGDAQLDVALRSDVAQLAIDQAAEKGVGASRLNSLGTALRTFSRWAEKRGMAERITDLDLPRVESRKPVVLTPHRVHELLAMLPEGQVRVVHAIAAFTAGRATEITAAHREDFHPLAIDLGGREVQKTAAARRSAPMLVALEPYIDVWEMPSMGRAFGEAQPRSIYSTVRKAAAEAWEDIEPRPTLHTLRHNFISWMFAAGVPLPAIQQISGHKTPLVPGVTLSVYGHPTEDHVEIARRIMNDWIAAQS